MWGLCLRRFTGASVVAVSAAICLAAAPGPVAQAFNPGPLCPEEPGMQATVLPALSGSATVGGTLSVTGGTWQYPGVNFYWYTWYSNGVQVRTSGGFEQSSDSYLVQGSDAGKIIYVTVKGEVRCGEYGYANSNSVQVADSGDVMGTLEPDQAAEIADDTVLNPASPQPMSPTGPVTSGYTTDLWPGDATGTADGLNVIASTAPSTSALTGAVQNDGTGDPVAGALVTMNCTTSCSTGPVSTTTDAQGSFAFINMPAATYTVSVSASGYGAYSLTGDSYAPNTTYNMTAPLTSSPQSFDESAAPNVAGTGDTTLASDPSTLHYSPTRVPPSIKVKMLAVYGPNGPAGKYCTTIDTSTPAWNQPGNVVNYAFSYYLIHTAWGELRSLVNYNQVGWQAFISLVQNFAWRHKEASDAGGPWDVYNAANVGAGQCFRPEVKVNIPQWNTWLQNVLPTRIINGAGHLALTQFSSGNAGPNLLGYCNSPPDYEHVHQTETGQFGYGPIASQWGIKAHSLPAATDASCQITDWRTVALLYYPTTWSDVAGMIPPPPAIDAPVVASGNITLGYHAISVGGQNVAWKFLIQRLTSSGWRTLATTKWSHRLRDVQQSLTFPAPSTCTRYRIKAVNPVGASLPSQVSAIGHGLNASGTCLLS